MNTFKLVVAATALCLLASASMAQGRRQVYINGVRLNSSQLATLQSMHCAFIPDGAYWLNLRTGAWGYAGNGRVQGYLGDPCRAGGNRGHRSLSERGLLYTPGDLNFR